MSLVEYALVLSLLVVGSLGVIQTLEDNTGDEVDNQANCISERPPPPSCQLQPLNPTTAPTAPSGGSGPPGSPGNPIPTSISASPPTTTPGAPWGIEVILDLLDTSTNTPIAGEVVAVKVSVTGSTFPSRIGSFFFVECTTNGAGQCTLTFDSRWPDVTQISFDVLSVGVETIHEFPDFPAQVVDAP